MQVPLHFVLSAPDNGSYWIRDLDDPDACCPECGCKLARELATTRFYLKKKSHDASYTYDGFLIVTERLLNALVEAGATTPLKAAPLPEDKRYDGRYFVVEPATHVLVDRSDPAVFIGPSCGVCGVPVEVSGPPEVRLQADRMVAGIWRTDVEFGSGFEKSPYVVVGVETAERLKRSMYRGVHLEPVFSDGKQPSRGGAED